MRVKAAPGLKVPIDGKPCKYITDEAFVEVPSTPYYRRRVMDGDLIEATDPPPVQPESKKGK